MKGLLYKDWVLIRKMGLQALIPLVVGIIILYSGEDKYFFIAYTSMVGFLSIISTITYDEYDNGMPMLLSLPYTRQDYVRAKYLLAGLAMLVLLIVEVSLISGMAALKGIENFVFLDNFLEIVVVLSLASIICWILIPVQLKYGAKKSMLAIVIVGGIVFIAGLGIAFLVKKYDLLNTARLKYILDFLANDWNVFFILSITMATFMGLSYLISTKVMQKREY
ncbi:ABC-2 transporter permease [Facklamia sp. 7083-14-GEN3]|uniref:ABC-2 transporter permease n=1 Tax=Facklamia sp. 7083-14-GEN3 TaxID=2973478 RepID=UPI00215D38FF|nr:ABC-2 transporter permease [Facklamia sp. 7083-14-GEN3]MCR8969357.1 ABC-2 transporter permease [Facklamia sp. 7083-14-GEN3]